MEATKNVIAIGDNSAMVGNASTGNGVNATASVKQSNGWFYGNGSSGSTSKVQGPDAQEKIDSRDFMNNR